MRILYHHRTQMEDAQGIHIYEMVKAFRDLGHDVDMVSIIDRDKKDSQEAHGKKWSIIAALAPAWLYEIMGLFYNVYGFYRLYRSIKEKRPDLIYERYALNTFCGILASRFFDIPLVLEVNAPLYYEQINLNKLTFKSIARFSERWICSNSTITIVVSHVMKEILIKEGVPENKIRVMPNGIDPQRVYPDYPGEVIRHNFNLYNTVVIGFVGWFRKWHGLEMLLEVMFEKNLGERGVRLLLVGDGPAYKDLVAYSKKKNLGSSVIFTGPVKQKDIASYIAAMDIAMQPSATKYACPMKLIEYMGMAKCIVAPDQPNIRELLEHKRTGYLFRIGDKQSMINTLLPLLESKELRKEIGQNACESVFDRKYLWSENAANVLKLIFGSKIESVKVAAL